MADPAENKPKLGELPSLLSDIKDVVFERIKNPFLASFSFFWIIWNWKIPFYLFLSDDQIEMKFTVVSKVYASFGNTFLFPFISAVLYFYLKDHFFNYLESTSNDAFLERKTTETNKTIELIKLEKKKVDALNELKDAQDKNVLKEKINKLSKDLLDQKNLNKNLNDSISNLKIDIEKFIETIRFDFEFDLRENQIKNLLNQFSDHELKKMGVRLSTLNQLLGNAINDETIMEFRELKTLGLLDFEVFSGGKLESYQLTRNGKFVLKYYIYSNDKLGKNKIDLNTFNFKI